MCGVLQGRLSGTVGRVRGLVERGARHVGALAVRTAVVRRAVRAAANVRRPRVAGSGAGAVPDDRGGRSDLAVQAQPLRPGRGVPGEPGLQGRPRRQLRPVSVRTRLQGRRGVALPGARTLLRARADIQRAEGLREGVPVRRPRGHRQVSADTLPPGPGVLADRQANR